MDENFRMGVAMMGIGATLTLFGATFTEPGLPTYAAVMAICAIVPGAVLVGVQPRKGAE